MNPLVSIVIPAYKRPDLLKKTLDSIQAQTYRNYEVWVVDDGSPDDNIKVVLDGLENVYYHRIENSGGPSRPRNEGIRKAKGSYIAFVDDDDIWVPEKLEKQVSVLEAQPDVTIVHSCCQVMDANGALSQKIIGRPGKPDVKSGDVSLRMAGNWTLMTSSVMARKTLLDQVGLFNESMPQVGEDMEYWVRCSFFGKFQYLDEPLVHYREHFSNSNLLHEKYIAVPFHLKRAVYNLQQVGMVSKAKYKEIRKNLVRMQIKKVELGFFGTLKYLFRLNPFWFLNFDNIKLFIKKIINP